MSAGGAARRAHKQDHLAIISSQLQIRSAKQTFIRKNGRGGKNRTGGGKLGEEGRAGVSGVWVGVGAGGLVIGAREGSACPSGEE